MRTLSTGDQMVGIKSWKDWLKMDISQLNRRRPRKLKLIQEIKLIQLMNNLFASGFNLTEVVDFLARSQLTDVRFVSVMRDGLTAGKNLSQILNELHFSKQVVTQVALADFHGNLAETLVLVETHLRKIGAIRQKFIAVTTYPVILLLFLMLIMLGLKNYLLPQMATKGESSGNIASVLIEQLPVIFLGSLGVIALAIAVLWQLARRRPALSNIRWLTQLPGARKLVKDYLTAYFSREWGILISQGLDFKKVLTVMSSAAQSRLISEVSQKMYDNMQKGSSFYKEVTDISIFTPEFALMIEYGELKAKLGIELVVYADECWTRFFTKIDRAMQMIQPLIFLFVALMIVLIYAAMLLPIYSNINVGI